MSFKRKENPVEAVELSRLSPSDVERKIIDAVRKYATRQDNWAKADKNTSFLGNVTGMGIESSNLVDIVMSIERLFLTRKTKRVTIEGGGIRLEDGELGKLMILEGQDIFSATPGLAVRMLMDNGHMPKDEAYLRDVVSFAYIVVVGEAYRLNDSLRKLAAKIEKSEDAAQRKEGAANLRALLDQARATIETLRDAKTVHRARQEAFAAERRDFDAIGAELEAVSSRLKDASASADASRLDELRSKQAELRLRMDTKKLMLRVAEQVALECGSRSQIEETKVQEVSRVLAASVGELARQLPALEAPPCPKPIPETTSSTSSTLSGASISGAD